MSGLSPLTSSIIGKNVYSPNERSVKTAIAVTSHKRKNARHHVFSRIIHVKQPTYHIPAPAREQKGENKTRRKLPCTQYLQASYCFKVLQE